jgi:hypothetical protein
MDKKILAGFISALAMTLPFLAISVSAVDSYVKVTVTGYCSTTLSSGFTGNVSFGSLGQGTTNNPATSNGDGETTNSSYLVTTSSNTNCNVTYSATDFSGAGTIAKANLKMNVTKFADGYAGNGTSTFASNIKVASVGDGEELYSNFFLTIPALQAKGGYQSELTVSTLEA